MSVLFEDSHIPASWSWSTLKVIGAIINGDRGKNYPSRQHYVDKGIPFISAGNISNLKLDLDSLNFITEEKYSALNSGKLCTGDIIYCIRGTLGKCAEFNLKIPAAISSSLTIFRVDKYINKNYVFYYNGSDKIMRQ